MRASSALFAAAAAASSSAVASTPYHHQRLLLALHRGSSGSHHHPNHHSLPAFSSLRPTAAPRHLQLLRMASSTSSNNNPPRKVTIIGAGIAGLTAARTLLELAPSPGLLQLTLLEKSTSHGRCATREVIGLGDDAMTFDHGAPGFRAATPEFRRQAEAWAADGVVAPFSAAGEQPDDYYYRGCPTMRSLPQHLAEGLDVRRPVLIERVARVAKGDGSAGGWVLYPQGGSVEEGRGWGADAVVVAVPPEQSAALLGGVEGAEALHAAIAGVESEPCITVLLAVPAKEGEGEGEMMAMKKFPPGADPVLSKAVRRRCGGLDCWVAHTTRAFTERYIHTSAEAFEKEAVVEGVVAAMRGAGLLPSPAVGPVLHADAQRWLYAQTFAAVQGVACGWDSRLQLGVCGDGWAGGVGGGEEEGGLVLEGVERAWLSGRAVGEAMAGEWWR